MSAELIETLAQGINRLHGECIQFDEVIRDALLAKVNKARECGLYLMEFKTACGHGRWLEKFRASSVFSEDTAQNYMAFARAHPEPITDLADGIGSLKQAMIASGAIKPPIGHATQTRSMLSWLDTFGSAALRLCGLFTGSLEKRQLTLDTLPPEDRQRAKLALKPAHDIYEQL